MSSLVWNVHWFYPCTCDELLQAGSKHQKHQFSQVHIIGWYIIFTLFFSSQKLINVSSEVMNIHIIPTQTKHFQTTYTKKVFFFFITNCLQVQPVFFSPWWLYLVPSVFTQVSTHPWPCLHAEGQILSWRVALLLWLHSGSLQGLNLSKSSH